MTKSLPSRIRFRGQSRCLKHLTPFTHRLTGHGPEGRDLVVRVSFETHVYSDARGSGLHDFVDERGNRRYFCETRYAVSYSLPTEIRAMLDRNVYTWETRDKNQIANLAVLTPATQSLTSGTHQVIIYYLHPSRLDAVDVEFLVKTCYSKTLNFQHHKRREKLRSLIKKAHYQQIRIPKN